MEKLKAGVGEAEDVWNVEDVLGTELGGGSELGLSAGMCWVCGD